MAKTTANYGLIKPERSDNYNVDVMSGNMDIVDTTINGHEERITTLEAGEFNKIKIPFSTDMGLLKVINISEIVQPFNFSVNAWKTINFTLPSFGINDLSTVIPTNPEDIVANVKVSVGQTNMVEYTFTIIDNAGNTVISKTGTTYNSALSFNETVPLIVNGKGMSYTGNLTLRPTENSLSDKSYSASVTAQYYI